MLRVKGTPGLKYLIFQIRIGVTVKRRVSDEDYGRAESVNLAGRSFDWRIPLISGQFFARGPNFVPSSDNLLSSRPDKGSFDLAIKVHLYRVEP